MKRHLARAGRRFNDWCALPCVFAAEVPAHQGYETLTIDMQHGDMWLIRPTADTAA